MKSNIDEDSDRYGPHDCDEAIALDALREIYLEAGLSDENARRSARADYQHNFGSLIPCGCGA